MAGKHYTRDMQGLIDACFDQLQDMRDGIATAAETIAFAKSADIVVRAVETDLKREALKYAHDQRMLQLANERLALEKLTTGDNSASQTIEHDDFEGEEDDDSSCPVVA
jgi:hypothetical protein